MDDKESLTCLSSQAYFYKIVHDVTLALSSFYIKANLLRSILFSSLVVIEKNP